MKLVYENTGTEVRIGDVVRTKQGESVTVTYFNFRNSNPEEKITVQSDEKEFYCYDLFASVIGAKWITT